MDIQAFKQSIIILHRYRHFSLPSGLLSPIQVGSHYHFIESNKFLQFDRARAYGMRLNINAGTATRFEPGDIRKVVLTEIAGNRIVRGGNRLCDGPVTAENLPAVMEKVKILLLFPREATAVSVSFSHVPCLFRSRDTDSGICINRSS